MRPTTSARDLRWWTRYLAATVVLGVMLTIGLFSGLLVAAAAGIDAADSAMAIVMYDPTGWLYLYALSFLVAGVIVWGIRTRRR